jgi:hypothetical protein
MFASCHDLELGTQVCARLEGDSSPLGPQASLACSEGAQEEATLVGRLSAATAPSCDAPGLDTFLTEPCELHEGSINVSTPLGQWCCGAGLLVANSSLHDWTCSDGTLRGSPSPSLLPPLSSSPSPPPPLSPSMALTPTPLLTSPLSPPSPSPTTPPAPSLPLWSPSLRLPPLPLVPPPRRPAPSPPLLSALALPSAGELGLMACVGLAMVALWRRRRRSTDADWQVGWKPSVRGVSRGGSCRRVIIGGRSHSGTRSLVPIQEEVMIDPDPDL